MNDDNSSNSSDSDSDSRVDHTYNPYNFKNINQALFKKPNSGKKEEIKV